MYGQYQLPIRFCRCLAEKSGEQRNQQETDQGDTAARHELLHALAFGTGIIVAVTFEQVDDAPNAETGTESNNEGLKNVDSRVKEIHKCVCRNAG